MKRAASLVLVMAIILWAGPALSAADHILIDLEPPKADLQRTGNGSFYIRTVTDDRKFGEVTSGPEVQSWGILNWREQTDELKHRTVGRVYSKGNDSEGQILISRGDVQSLMEGAVAAALSRLGYKVTESEKDIKPDTVPVDISITRFWGYFKKAFIGGDIYTFIDATITLNKKDKIEKRTIQISDSDTVLHPQKPANWEKVFSMAIEDFTRTAVKELKQ